MRIVVKVFLLLLFMLSTVPSFAAWVATELQVPEDGDARISLQFLQSQYATDATFSTQANSYQYIIPRFYTKSSKKKAFQYEVDFNSVLPMSKAGETHYFFPELYMGLDDSRRGLSFYFGRKRIVWSELDQQMNLGLWQPLFRWDHARPMAMGLTGFHFESRQKYLVFNVMISPFYLPDQQPDFNVDSGQILSGNRWFRPPTNVLRVGNTDSDVYYNVNEPEVKDVVLNESYALSARLGQDQGGFLKASWADKPINQFHLGVNTDDSLRLDSEFELEATVTPFVVRHKLLTLEAGYIERDLYSFISFTSEKIEDPKIPESWEETELIDSNYLGVGLKHAAPIPFIPNSRITWGYSRRDKASRGQDATRIEGELDASTQRMAFKNWFSVKWDATKVLKKNRSLHSGLGYNYSPSDDGDWLTLDMTLNWDKSWQWFVSADVLGVGKEAAPEETSFISTYRNNDRVQGGFVYVF